MSLSYLDPIQGLIHQESGDAEATPVLYLPGVHGDWSFMDSARELLSERFRLIEVTYPRAGGWTLETYAGALDDLLDVLDLESVHLIGESFGSRVGWELGLNVPERIRSMVLVGGLCGPLRSQIIGAARQSLHRMPGPMLERGFDLFLSIKDWMGDPWPEGDERAIPYVTSQSPRARRAAANRLGITFSTDFVPRLHRVRFPVAYVGGGSDPVVPVRREIESLRRRLPRHCDFRYHVIPGAPHTLLASHPRSTCERIVGWISAFESRIRVQEACH